MAEKTIYEQMREMETKAKQSEIWEKRYKDLREKTIQIVKTMSEELSINIIEKDFKLPKLVTKEFKISNKNIYLLVDNIYKYLMDTDKEIGTEFIRQKLLENKLCTAHSYITSVIKLLEKKQGIGFRKDGLRKYYYYVKTSGNNGDAVEFLKTIGRVSING